MTKAYFILQKKTHRFTSFSGTKKSHTARNSPFRFAFLRQNQNQKINQQTQTNKDEIQSINRNKCQNY